MRRLIVKKTTTSDRARSACKLNNNKSVLQAIENMGQASRLDQVGQGHKKCYYSEISSIVKSKLAALFLVVAEEENRIERQR